MFRWIICNRNSTSTDEWKRTANCSIIIDDDANWNFERNRPIKECPQDSRGVKYGNGISVLW